ncbi:NUDIX hydrolase [Paenibacillus sp. RC67]|uniref:NUDIX hydrolase n=1 Tax=Paenibacillus sp. RC67 TaxID=3039392 RepID=UPI0024AE1FAE|nr:NUDIX hydrolase [Paenibacillus sp. RC67]
MINYTHIGVYGVLIRNEQILLIQKARGPHKGKWDLPGGSIEFGEEPYTALKREFVEETGIDGIHGTLRTALSYTMVYPYTEDQLEHLHHIGMIYHVHLNHQNFELKTCGDGQDSLGAKWFQLEEAKALQTTPFVMQVLTSIMEMRGHE